MTLPVGALAEGMLHRTTAPDGEPVCVFRFRGELHAVHDTCTHAEFAMSDGTLESDGTIECAWHGARFDCRTGAVVRGPADEPLPVYEVRVEDDSVVVGARKSA